MGMYLSTDSVITAADMLMETFTTSTPLQPGGSVFFPLIEGTTNSVDIPAGVAPGQYFVGYLADDLGQMFETNEANNYVSAATAQLTVVGQWSSPRHPPCPAVPSGVTLSAHSAHRHRRNGSVSLGRRCGAIPLPPGFDAFGRRA